MGSDVARVAPRGYRRVVIRLRLVDEYRGRRIVTNGTMYGIQGELITDCRYLNVAGARAAIDSEIAIERRKRDLDEQRAQFENYVEREGRERAFGCECGWRGSYGALKRTGMSKLFRCPACASDYIFIEGGDPPDGP